ncbi:hypothetical protein [Symbiopectobacterium purcellii]|uniref:hypothetical protein n=1 Tax=Symbiopectobacterium purcellii TaxID=2871826 RepID=UPI003F83C088
MSLKAAIANRLKNDYILCPDMRQRSIAGCYQNNVAWLYHCLCSLVGQFANDDQLDGFIDHRQQE